MGGKYYALLDWSSMILSRQNLCKQVSQKIWAKWLMQIKHLELGWQHKGFSIIRLVTAELSYRVSPHVCLQKSHRILLYILRLHLDLNLTDSGRFCYFAMIGAFQLDHSFQFPLIRLVLVQTFLSASAFVCGYHRSSNSKSNFYTLQLYLMLWCLVPGFKLRYCFPPAKEAKVWYNEVLLTKILGTVTPKL